VSGKHDDLERRFRWLSVGAVFVFSAALAFGLLLYVADQGSDASRIALQTGLVLLMSAPAVRILVATAERIRRRDWTFLLMTAIVAIELSLVLRRAATRI
jgi:hypothetical protein